MKNNQILNTSLAAVLLSCLAAVTARADYSNTVASFNPLGYWRFNETATAPALNTVANASSLGSIATGYVVGEVAKGEPGVVGNAIRFNNSVGTAHCSAKVDVPYNAALNPQPPFSIEFWAKPTAQTLSSSFDATGACPLSNFDPNLYGGNRSGWLFYVAPTGRWNFRLGNTGGYAGNLLATGGSATANVWQHVVATYDGTTANLYINGTLAGTVAASVANWVANSESFLRVGGTPLNGDGTATGNFSGTDYVAPGISASGNGGNRGWDGWIDEVALFPTVLSVSQIAAHHDAAATNNAGYNAQILADSPIAYWGFSEPAVTPPNPTTFPAVANSGSLGSTADGTVEWGALTAQSGPTGADGSVYPGLGAGNKALFLDGRNGYVQLNDAAGLHFNGQITMMAWVKPTEKDFFRDILGHGVDFFGAETFLRISRGGGTTGYGDGNYYEVGSSDFANFYDSVLSPIPPGDIGNWVFVAGTYDGANWNLYRNGVLVGSVPSNIGGAFDVTNRWTIGSRSDPSVDQGWNLGGGLDEPAIFNTALSAANINAVYNAAQVPPVITRAVQVPSGVYKGSSGSFDVWAEGSPSLTYLWWSNGISTGITATNLTLNNLAAGSLTVGVSVTNPYGSNYSAVTFNVVASAPFILQQPQPVARYVGLPFSLSVVAGGTTPLSYQWKTNNVAILGANSSTYSGTMSAATAGSYICTVTNEAGTMDTAPATVTAVPVPAGYASAVITNSTAPIAYWRLGETTGSVAYDYYGGNNGTYFNATLDQSGYSVIDPDKAAAFAGPNSYVGSISGTAINFTGHTNFTIEAWVKGPASQNDGATVIAKGIGDSGTTRTEQFSLDVSGGFYRFFTTRGTTVYEADASVGPNGSWQHIVCVYDDLNTYGGTGPTMYIYVNGEMQGNRSTITQGLNNTTTPVSIGSKRGGNDPTYDGTFSGTIDEVSIYPYAMPAATVLAHYGAAYGPSLAPFINVQPAPITNYVTLPAQFSVSAAGTVPLSYQWKRNGVDLSDGPTASGSVIAGSSADTLVINNLASADAGTYSVGVTNAISGLLSSGAQLTVLSAPTGPVSVGDLVVHLPFDNSLADATGRGNNGVSIHVATNTASGGYTSNTVAATYVTDGKLGAGFHYATAAVNTGGTTSDGTDTTYATLGVRPDLQFGTSVSFSVAFWIRLPLNFIGGDLPFFTDARGSLGNQGFVFAPAYGFGTADANPNPAPDADGSWGVSVYDAGGANGVRIYSGDVGTINDGDWHHLVYVVDRSTGVKVYLDGVAAKSRKEAGTTIVGQGSIDSGLPATIGQDPTGHYGESGSGDIDDLGVWRRALTPLDVASVYMAAKVGGFSFTGPPPLASVAIARISGTTINYSGGSGSQYVLLSSSSAGAPLTGWTRVGTNSTTPGTFTIPAVGSSAQTFYSIKSE